MGSFVIMLLFILFSVYDFYKFIYSKCTILYK